MHPYDIISLIKKAGKTQTEIAGNLGVPVSTVNSVIHGRCKSLIVAEHIAKITKKSTDKLWPGRYSYEPRKRTRPTPLPIAA